MPDYTQPTTLDVDAVFESDRWNEEIRDNAPIPFRKVTTKAVTNTTTETDLLNGEFTIPANALGTLKEGILRARGDFTCTNGPLNAPRFKLNIGGTTVLDTGVSADQISGNADPMFWWIDVKIQQLGAANSQYVDLRGMISARTGSGQVTTGTGHYKKTGGTGSGDPLVMNLGKAATIDMTSARALELKVINATAVATYETRLLVAKFEIGT